MDAEDVVLDIVLLVGSDEYLEKRATALRNEAAMLVASLPD